MEWFDVEECHPDFNVRVLVMVGGNNPRIEISSYLNNGDKFGWPETAENEDITHWAYLPDFPETKPSIPVVLNADRQQNLFDHLCDYFDAQESAFYLGHILLCVEEYIKNHDERESTSIQYKKFSALASDAYDLYLVCRGESDLNQYAPACWALKNKLRDISGYALSEMKEKAQKRGRPAETKHRNKLIKDIYSCYSKRVKGIKNEDSHFENTVSMILKWVEPSPPDDIHSVIMRAFKS